METIVRTEPFDYGDQRGYIVPYVVSQLTGAYQSVPTFLDRQHQIHDKDDAEATWRGCGPSPWCSTRRASGCATMRV